MPSSTVFPPSPSWTLNYTGAAFNGSILGVTRRAVLVDNPGGRSGDLQVDVSDELKQWQGPLIPVLGDTLRLLVGYEGQPKYDAGPFQIDSFELSGPPDVFHIKAIPAPVDDAIHTRNSYGFENVTLREIATQIANKHGYAIALSPSPPLGFDIKYDRITQYRENDLAFLRRLALNSYTDFRVVPNPTTGVTTLVFYALDFLETQPNTGTLNRTDVDEFSFHGLTHLIYAQVQASYFDPFTKTLITYTTPRDPRVPAGIVDIFKLNDRCESLAVATSLAAAKLRTLNNWQYDGELTTPGTVQYAAGDMVGLVGFGAFDGKWHIDQITHTMERGKGFTTKFKLWKVLPGAPSGAA